MKYALTNTTKQIRGITYYQIVALKDFSKGRVTKGDLGGWIANENCLSQTGECWIDEDVIVDAESKVMDNAYIKGTVVLENYAKVSGNALISGDYYISGIVTDNAVMFGSGNIAGHIKENARIYKHCYISSGSVVSGKAEVNDSKLEDKCLITDEAMIINCKLSGTCVIGKNSQITNNY